MDNCGNLTLPSEASPYADPEMRQYALEGGCVNTLAVVMQLLAAFATLLQACSAAVVSVFALRYVFITNSLVPVIRRIDSQLSQW
jgi:hypothetical protein